MWVFCLMALVNIRRRQHILDDTGEKSGERSTVQNDFVKKVVTKLYDQLYGPKNRIQSNFEISH